MLRGAGNDELWALTSPYEDLLHINGGNVERAPALEAAIEEIFTSSTHQLHARTTDGTIFRLDADKWIPVAHVALPKKEEIRSTVLDARGLWWATGKQAYQLRSASPSHAPPPTCANWFVHLLTSEPNANPPNFKYPAVQKQLAGFASDLRLVEYAWVELGVPVTSHDQGAALVEHLRSAPGLRPKLMCFAPTERPRTINP